MRPYPTRVTLLPCNSRAGGSRSASSSSLKVNSADALMVSSPSLSSSSDRTFTPRSRQASKSMWLVPVLGVAITRSFGYLANCASSITNGALGLHTHTSASLGGGKVSKCSWYSSHTAMSKSCGALKSITGLGIVRAMSHLFNLFSVAHQRRKLARRRAERRVSHAQIRFVQAEVFFDVLRSPRHCQQARAYSVRVVGVPEPILVQRWRVKVPGVSRVVG